MDSKLSKFEKLRIAARYWLLGMAQSDPAYFKVVEAMEYGLEHHTGTRNGGEPEFIHQLGIFHQVRTLHKHIRNPSIVYTLIFLHDAIEDPRTDKDTNEKHYVSLEDVEKRWGAPVVQPAPSLRYARSGTVFTELESLPFDNQHVQVQAGSAISACRCIAGERRWCR